MAAPIMLMDPMPEHGYPAVTLDGFNLHLHVDDADRWFDRAVAAGCTVVMPMALQFWGDRYGLVKDPYGMSWGLGRRRPDPLRAPPRPTSLYRTRSIMAGTSLLKRAKELARQNGVRFPNESEATGAPRDELLAEEIELAPPYRARRRAAPRPAAGRRRSTRTTASWARTGRSVSPSCSAQADAALYSYMFGPQRARPCPMCTSLLSAWEGEARDVEQRIALAVVARSPDRAARRVQEGSAAGGTSGSIRTRAATTPGTMSTPRMRTCPPSTSFYAA
jgi:hypothetical protein